MNVFPAVLAVNGVRQPGTVRAIGGPDGTVTVWRWNGTTGEIAAEGTGVEPAGARAWSATTSDGQSMTITKAGGCGCGHPLKRWSPPGARRQHV